MHFRSNSEGTRPLEPNYTLHHPADPFNFVLLHIVDRIRHINAQIDKRLVYKPVSRNPNPWQPYDNCI